MSLIVFGVVGRLLIWVWQTSGPTTRIWSRSAFLREMAECDFCTGCWVYFALAFLFRQNWIAPAYMPVVSELITGIAMSFVAHLAALGWRTKWGYEKLE